MRVRLAVYPVRMIVVTPFLARVAQFFKPPPSDTVDFLAVCFCRCPSAVWRPSPVQPHH